ncbi:MAG: F0F1 ATP synthase subunit epsilon [Chlorobiales bacterium]|nr:F0F1 ATP synthase subunit epsilon [Chlorobiales bacterium]
MDLEILVPFRVFARKDLVLKIVAETPGGSYGILPNRLDCVAPLVPGILMYEDLGQLQEAVEHDFINLDERERTIRSSLAKLESSFIRRYAEFHHE